MWYWIIGIAFILGFFITLFSDLIDPKNHGRFFVLDCISNPFYIYFWFTRRYRALIVAIIIFSGIYLFFYWARKKLKMENEGEKND